MDVRKRIEIAEQQTPRDERALAFLYAERASMHLRWALWHEAAADIQKSIDWGEAQNPRDEGALAKWYVIRASILKHFGHHKQALEDIERSIAWFLNAGAIDQGRMISLCWSRASSRGNLAIAAQEAGRTQEAAALFRLASDEMARALAWWETHEPEADRWIDGFWKEKLHLDSAAQSKPSV